MNKLEKKEARTLWCSSFLEGLTFGEFSLFEPGEISEKAICITVF